MTTTTPSSSPATPLKKVFYAPNGFEAYGEHEIKAVDECLRAGWLAGFGSYSQRFEQRMAQLFGKKYGLFVNSGSSANLLALAALNLPAGSRVVTPACTFSTTVAPILQLGLEPVFVDVELDTYLPSIQTVMNAVDQDVKVVMLPNLIGNVPDWAGLRAALRAAGRADVVLIEDSADTIPQYEQHNNNNNNNNNNNSSSVDHEETTSHIATTSFYASHVITACGSGGMVMFNTLSQLKRATMYRDWGRVGDNGEEVEGRFTEVVDGIVYDAKFLYGVLGYNFKSSEVNAAFGLAQLDRLDGFVKTRRHNFDTYIDVLSSGDVEVSKSLVLPQSGGGAKSINWLAIPLQITPDPTTGEPRRMALLRHLESRGIQTRVLFSGNVTRHPAYRAYLKEFPNADRIMRDGFLLGCHHGMTEDDVKRVCSEIINFHQAD